MPRVEPVYFGCNQCGDCCREMRIPLSHEDLLRIAATRPQEPLEDWLYVYPVEDTHPDGVRLNGQMGLLLLRQRDGACVFLRDNACGIYGVRPRVCRIWPLEKPPRGERPLRVAPQHELLVKLACDRTPMDAAEQREVLQEIEAIARAYRQYDWRIQEWNARATPEDGLQEFVAFLRDKT